jgi:uncharacterized membrane protein YfcA
VLPSLLALFATGLLAGVLGAILGLGGGIFVVPALTLVFHLPMPVAVGTSLVGVIATSAGVASVAGPGRGGDVSLAMRLEVTTAAGAILGGLLAGVMTHETLSVLFALVVFFTAGYLTFKGRRQEAKGVPERLYDEAYHARRWPLGMSVALLAGVVSGLLGVGGGFIKVPVMYAVMDVPLGIATATSNFMVGITAAASFFVYYGRGDIRPLVAVPTALGVFTGAMLGVHLLGRLRASAVRATLVGLLVLIGIQMLAHGLGYGR